MTRIFFKKIVNHAMLKPVLTAMKEMETLSSDQRRIVVWTVTMDISLDPGFMEEHPVKTTCVISGAKKLKEKRSSKCCPMFTLGPAWNAVTAIP